LRRLIAIGFADVWEQAVMEMMLELEEIQSQKLKKQ
jgi:hypothetical protein